MFSETPDIISISSHHKIEVLSASEIETLKKGKDLIFKNIELETKLIERETTG
jgi:hypothetical protein